MRKDIAYPTMAVPEWLVCADHGPHSLQLWLVMEAHEPSKYDRYKIKPLTREYARECLHGITEAQLSQALRDLERVGGLRRESGRLVLECEPRLGFPGQHSIARYVDDELSFDEEEPSPARVAPAKAQEKHYLYAVEHREFEAVKIGISAEHAWLGEHGRLAAHEKQGWVRRNELLLPSIGVRTAERTILRRLWHEGHRPALTPAQMPQGGATETFNSADVPAARLWRVIGEVCGFIGEGVA